MQIVYHRQEAYHNSKELLELMDAQAKGLDNIEAHNRAAELVAFAKRSAIRLAEIPVEWYARIIRGTPPNVMQFRLNDNINSIVDSIKNISFQTQVNMFISMHSDGVKRQVMYGMTLVEFYAQLNALSGQLYQNDRPDNGSSVMAYVTEEELGMLHSVNLLLYVNEPGYILWKDV